MDYNSVYRCIFNFDLRNDVIIACEHDAYVDIVFQTDFSMNNHCASHLQYILLLLFNALCHYTVLPCTDFTVISNRIIVNLFSGKFQLFRSHTKFKNLHNFFFFSFVSHCVCVCVRVKIMADINNITLKK